MIFSLDRKFINIILKGFRNHLEPMDFTPKKYVTIHLNICILQILYIENINN